jgi:HNH endonuclease
MSLLAPFAYPDMPHVRHHGPRGYKDCVDYKPFLRDEFVFRCVYCLERELWYPDLDASFSVDHFSPKVLDPHRTNDYDNLVYACTRCNSFKQSRIIFLDPTAVSFADHLRVKTDGLVEGLSPQGCDLIDLLHLNDGPAIDVRRKMVSILRLMNNYPEDRDVREVFVATFAFPKDLPDLSRLRPPDGNTRLEGIANSHFQRRQKGTLPEVY